MEILRAQHTITVRDYQNCVIDEARQAEDVLNDLSCSLTIPELVEKFSILNDPDHRPESCQHLDENCPDCIICE